MDWELEAIVRGGCNNELASSSSTIGHDDQFDQYYQPFGFGSFGFQQDMLLNFPDICETSIIFDELEDLYKPFYPQAILTSTTSMSAPTAQVAKPKKLDKQQQQPPPTPLLCGDNSTVGGGDADHVAKPKKSRKNQPKRVVHQATADGLSTDMWAWRKYGQKPIKGSPYPRSYYRCSSSKGCPARKQVERSSSDPGLLVMTYSGEHNHTHPKRRSSLAGSSRPRSSIITTRSATNGSTKHVTGDLPPPPVTSTVDELGHQQTIKKEGGEGEEIENLTSDDIIFNDECFPSLEDLEGSLLGQFPGEDFSEPNWFINESAAGHGGS